MASGSAVRNGIIEQWKVELSISCSNLPNLDRFSKSDPVCFLYKNDHKHANSSERVWTLVGRTEMIRDNLNPKFSKKFVVPYNFEEVQLYRASVYDVDVSDKNIDNINKHDFIGEAEFTIADVVTAGKSFSKELISHKRKSCGVIHIQGEEIGESKYDITMKLYCTKLDKKDFFGKSDPFVEVSKVQEKGERIVVYRSKAMMKTLDPRWTPFTRPIQSLCNGDWDRLIQFRVYDWNKSGVHKLIGETSCTLRKLTTQQIGEKVTELALINPELKAKKGSRYHDSGILHFANVSYTASFTFIDYIKGGCSINLMVAIDFTSSNGKPINPNSLHYNDPTKENQYVRAIKSVGSILACYDHDQLFPVFGFGARVPHKFQGVSHCFPLNFNNEEPEVKGIQGILDAYQYTLGVAELYGPTNFSLILDKAMSYASNSVTQKQQSYHILLIITDGIITDMERSIDKIVQASSLPLSIVIVGVGKADFSAMDVLDADNKRLVDSCGKKMSRDIVQFVPLRKYANQVDNFPLAKETLAEIPKQFVSYMEHKGIGPNPPIRRPLQRMSSSPLLRAPFSSNNTTILQSFPYPSSESYPRQQPVSYHNQMAMAKSVPTTSSYPIDSKMAPYCTNSTMPPYPLDSMTSSNQSDSYPANQDYPPPYSSSNGMFPYPGGASTPPPYPTVSQQ
ncbi:copine-9-like [Dysidea avara]|uniref:copine-9-like n=1 Tax=Dysidea avara TaxID=196820 RepID=UPI003326472D